MQTVSALEAKVYNRSAGPIEAESALEQSFVENVNYGPGKPSRYDCIYIYTGELHLNNDSIFEVFLSFIKLKKDLKNDNKIKMYILSSKPLKRYK